MSDGPSDGAIYATVSKRDATADELAELNEAIERARLLDAIEGDDPCHGPEDTTCPCCGLGNYQKERRT